MTNGENDEGMTVMTMVAVVVVMMFDIGKWQWMIVMTIMVVMMNDGGRDSDWWWWLWWQWLVMNDGGGGDDDDSGHDGSSGGDDIFYIVYIPARVYLAFSVPVTQWHLNMTMKELLLLEHSWGLTTELWQPSNFHSSLPAAPCLQV